MEDLFFIFDLLTTELQEAIGPIRLLKLLNSVICIYFMVMFCFPKPIDHFLGSAITLLRYFTSGWMNLLIMTT